MNTVYYTIMMITQTIPMTKRKLEQLKIGHSEECLEPNSKARHSLTPLLLLPLLAVLSIPLTLQIRGQGLAQGHFRAAKETSFVTSDQLESHKPQADVSNVGSSGTGDVSITMHPHSRQKQPQQKKSQNDKYFIDLYEGQNIECIFDYFQDSGLYMKQTFFEIREEDILKNLSSGCLKGNLKRHFKFWEEIGASDFVLDTIKHGYIIPFYETPEESFNINNKSARDNMEFVNGAVSELVKKGCVIKVPFKPHVVNPLSVSINKKGKKRLILDLRIPNKFVWKERVKFEDWKIALSYFEQDSYMFKFDLTSGYFHLDINIKFQTYLGFRVDNEFYCFTVLPFGLSSAPFIFTKCLRPMVKHWRKNCIKMVMFLDDGFGMSRGLEKARKEAMFVKDSLIRAGFLINSVKSIWEPQLSLEWTGIWWDGGTHCISISERRIDDLKREIALACSFFPKTSARSIAKIVGKIISMMPVIGNVARLKTRYLYFMINNRLSWDNIFSISQYEFALDEIFFWKYTVDSLNSRCLSNYSLTENFLGGISPKQYSGQVVMDLFA